MRAARRGVKRLDASVLRDLVADQRIWAAVGTVIQPDGEAGAEHYELVPGEAGAIVDILVEVVLEPHNIEVTCRLGGAGGARGVITVPDVGDEVLIVVPDGLVDWMPVIVARMSTGLVPNPTGQGPDTSTTVIMDGRVVVHDGQGGAGPLVRKSDFDGHAHELPALVGASYAAGPPASGVNTAGADDVPGTQVLLAK